MKESGTDRSLDGQFRAEFFNVFNNVNFGNPNTSVSSGNFGRITGLHGVFGSPRIVQFG